MLLKWRCGTIIMAFNEPTGVLRSLQYADLMIPFGDFDITFVVTSRFSYSTKPEVMHLSTTL